MQTLKSLIPKVVRCATNAMALFVLSGCIVERHPQRLHAASAVSQLAQQAWAGEVPIVDRSDTIRLRDAVTGTSFVVTYFFGGSPALTKGAIGLFDDRGRLLEAKAVSGFSGLDAEVSIMGQHDSVILRITDAYGPGFRRESLLVLTVHNGRFSESLRCAGDSSSTQVEYYEERVQLVPTKLLDDSVAIVRLVEIDAYQSQDKQVEMKPQLSKRYAEVYQFNARSNRFVRAYE